MNDRMKIWLLGHYILDNNTLQHQQFLSSYAELKKGEGTRWVLKSPRNFQEITFGVEE